MKRISLIFLFFLLLSCQDDNLDCCTNLDVDVNMTVKSEDGTDLLNPDNPGAYLENDIWLYHLVDGEVKRYYQGNLDAARGFHIDWIESTDSYVIQIFPNDAESEEYPTTYIQWSKDDTDTLRCEYRRTRNLVICSKVWFNEELKWEVQDGSRVLEITK